MKTTADSVLPVLGLVYGKKTGNALYLVELIRYEGFLAQELSLDQLEKAAGWPRLLVFVDEIQITAKMRDRCLKHLQAGNAIVAIGPARGIEDLLGITYRAPGAFPFPVGGFKSLSVGEGYLQYCDSELLAPFRPLDFPLHGFGCLPVHLQSASSLADYQVVTHSAPDAAGSRIRPIDDQDKCWPAITVNQAGKGLCCQVAVDLVKTIRHIQEGRYVEADGIPPSDGMAPIDDGILKCEDGCVLDWNRDRRLISPSHHVPAFIIPIADIWRRILGKTIEYCADNCDIPARRVDYWPDSAEFIGLISHDTDGNNEQEALEMLARVDQFGIKTTWCLIPPGYSPDTCRKILDSGHELAFHFDAQSAARSGVFSLEEFESQVKEVSARTGIADFYSNKNHYTRWERKNEFFEWCVALGIKIDQSKGPSKCGTLGFPFGSAHPWRAMNGRGELINCYELAFVSQDLGLQGPVDTGDDLLEACRRVRGVCHLIFHPAHVRDQKVESAFGDFVASARAKGARFMRSDEIGRWIELRREAIETCRLPPGSGLVLLTRNGHDRKWEKITDSR